MGTWKVGKGERQSSIHIHSHGVKPEVLLGALKGVYSGAEKVDDVEERGFPTLHRSSNPFLKSSDQELR
jgi:hypothetical protein